MEDRIIFVCDCHSLEHQLAIYYDEEFNQLHFEPHLVDSHIWWQRLIFGIKYIFGHKSRYGAWDDMILKNEDIPKLQYYLDEIEVEDVKRKKEINLL